MAVPFAPKQSLGQNFLHDPNTIRKIAGALRAGADDPVVEIGAGTGALTELLAARHPRLVALEIDERAVKLLHRTLPEAEVRHQDVLQTDWPALAEEMGGRLHVIGNLPYNLTSPILFGLLDAKAHLAEAVLMVQKEVAERFVASTRTKAYGILSVLVQHHAEAELLFDVSPNVFYPRPEVTSAVVRLAFGKKKESEAAPVDPEALRRVVRAAFNQRRKMLRNSLSAWTKARGLTLPNGWGRKRAEALTPADFAALTRYLAAHSEADVQPGAGT